MLLDATSSLFVVHPTLSLPALDPDHDHARVCAAVERADFDRSILEQFAADHDLFVLDWGLETPDARGILDTFRQRVPDGQVLVIADDVPTDDPVDRGADELLVAPVSGEALRSTIERLLLQRAYERATDEFFRLSTERALLESEREAGVDVSSRYRTVVDDLREQRRRAGELRAELSDEEFERALRQLLDDDSSH